MESESFGIFGLEISSVAGIIISLAGGLGEGTRGSLCAFDESGIGGF